MPRTIATMILTTTLALLSAGPLYPDDCPTPAGRPRIGLVLSGGGARGSAHAGVLKVLEDSLGRR